MIRFFSAYIFCLVLLAGLAAFSIPRVGLASDYNPKLAASEVGAGLEKVKGPFAGISKFDTSDPYKFAGELIKIALQVGFMIAIVFLIIGGYFFMTARGNQEQSAQGRRTIIYALIGVAVMIMAYVAVSVVVDLVSN